MAVESASIALALLLVGSPAPPPPESAADRITLRDGKILLGQVVEPSPRGTVLVVVRRAWADAKLPDWSKRWQANEKAGIRKAVAQRRERLTVWNRERAVAPKAGDPVVAWIERELKRLDDPASLSSSPLLTVSLSRTETRSIVRRSRTLGRLLRLGWVSGFNNVETMPVTALEQSLEDRGFATKDGTSVPLDELLPLAPETENHWLARRAATEVKNDPALKFLRTQTALLPEPEPGQPLPAEGALDVLADLKKQLSGDQTDPLMEKLHAVALRGRIGVLVTRLDISPDLSTVQVESALLVRARNGQWSPATRRTASVRTDALAPDAGQALADDPQVKAVFNIVESLGLGNITEDIKRRSLNMGAATRNALGQVRSALAMDLDALAFPVNDLAKEPEKVPN
jgi:hypothetical protein